MRRYHLEIGKQEVVVDVQELTADRFEVQIGGESYDVRLTGDEDSTDVAIAPAPGPATIAPATPAAPSAVPTPIARVPAPRVAFGNRATLTAPMPGVILEVQVKPGDVVTRGQPVAVLDAMKMHNIIGAPRAGTIAEVFVSTGQNVNHGDPLLRYAEE